MNLFLAKMTPHMRLFELIRQQELRRGQKKDAAAPTGTASDAFLARAVTSLTR
ncbi:hypothetical protein [uncultured Tateyamaria sp.]|uniref:hypothetical protein n=1 Tax=uncultured Tateyamaria sp. TaxID=455651 RepID=UPI002623D9C5|nr:hypothetical protein [uncultured Tateyamaria sp.]